MTSAGFEPAIPATKRPQTYALDRAATGIGVMLCVGSKNFMWAELLDPLCNNLGKERKW
jgi:hypothetical protein